MLWDAIRGCELGYKFRRQHIIGNNIADFICRHLQLIIEVDEGCHNSISQQKKDQERTEELKALGFKFLRFSNDEIIGNLTEVIKQINNGIMGNKHSKETHSTHTATATHKSAAPLLFGGQGEIINPPSYRHDTVLPLPMEVSANAIAVDAACSGNPGPMEYQGIDLATGARVFHFGPLHGTNNIGEFLAIVHALALLEQKGMTDKTIYSDSYNAILWVKKKQCKTKLPRTPQTEELFNIIARAENWLRTHTVATPIVKWETAKWGEVPADFGRK